MCKMITKYLINQANQRISKLVTFKCFKTYRIQMSHYQCEQGKNLYFQLNVSTDYSLNYVLNDNYLSEDKLYTLVCFL